MPTPLSRMILIDNNVISAILHPRNVMVVRDWLSKGAADTELARVSSALDAFIAEVQNGEPRGYVDCLVDAQPGHADFQRRLCELHTLLDAEPPDGQPIAQVLKAVWNRAAEIKRGFLDLKEGEH